MGYQTFNTFYKQVLNYIKDSYLYVYNLLNNLDKNHYVDIIAYEIEVILC